MTPPMTPSGGPLPMTPSMTPAPGTQPWRLGRGDVIRMGSEEFRFYADVI